MSQTVMRYQPGDKVFYKNKVHTVVQHSKSWIKLEPFARISIGRVAKKTITARPKSVF